MRKSFQILGIIIAICFIWLGGYYKGEKNAIERYHHFKCKSKDGFPTTGTCNAYNYFPYQRRLDIVWLNKDTTSFGSGHMGDIDSVWIDGVLLSNTDNLNLK